MNYMEQNEALTVIAKSLEIMAENSQNIFEIAKSIETLNTNIERQNELIETTNGYLRDIDNTLSGNSNAFDNPKSELLKSLKKIQYALEKN